MQLYRTGVSDFSPSRSLICGAMLKSVMKGKANTSHSISFLCTASYIGELLEKEWSEWSLGRLKFYYQQSRFVHNLDILDII